MCKVHVSGRARVVGLKSSRINQRDRDPAQTARMARTEHTHCTLTGFERLGNLAVALAPQVEQLALLRPLPGNLRVALVPDCEGHRSCTGAAGRTGGSGVTRRA